MIEPTVQSPVKNQTSAGHGTKSDRTGDKSGFSDALSGAERRDRKGGETGKETLADSTIAETEGQVGETLTNVRRAALDLQPSALRSAKLTEPAAGENGMFIGQPDQLPSPETVGKTGSLVAPVREAKHSAKAVTVEAGIADKPGDIRHPARHASTLHSKDGTRTETAREVGSDLGDTAPTKTPAEGLGDVLTLLQAGDNAAATLPAAAAQAAQGAGHKNAGKNDGNADTAGKDAMSELDAALRPKADAAASDPVELPREAPTDDNAVGFRAVRADGKGQPLSIRLSESGELAASQSGDSSQTVTVFDSRRYIAPASTSNAANIAAAMTGDREWAGAMAPGSELLNAASNSSAGKVVNTLKIQLNPADLGSVTATLRLVGDALTVHLQVENSAAYRKISDDQSDIVQTLRAQGYTVDSVQVSIASSGGDKAGADGGQGANQQQNGQQQNGQQAQAGGQQSGDNSRRDERPHFGRTNQGSFDDTHATPHGGSGGTGAGGVYL